MLPDWRQPRWTRPPRASQGCEAQVICADAQRTSGNSHAPSRSQTSAGLTQPSWTRPPRASQGCGERGLLFSLVLSQDAAKSQSHTNQVRTEPEPDVCRFEAAQLDAPSMRVSRLWWKEEESSLWSSAMTQPSHKVTPTKCAPSLSRRSAGSKRPSWTRPPCASPGCGGKRKSLLPLRPGRARPEGTRWAACPWGLTSHAPAGLGQPASWLQSTATCRCASSSAWQRHRLHSPLRVSAHCGCEQQQQQRANCPAEQLRTLQGWLTPHSPAGLA